MIKTKLPTLLSLDRLCNLVMYSHRCAAQHPQGIIAEFGVYKGGSLEALARTNPDRAVYGIDSFQGLPEANEHDYHVEGEFADVDYLGMVGYFKVMYPNVRILKGFSPSVFGFFDEHCKFSFVHLDVDLYQSIKDALEFFWDRMLPGGHILFDDYGFTSTPGVKKAIEEWLPEKELKFAGQLAYPDGELMKQYLIIK